MLQPSCTNDPYADGRNPMLNVVHCTQASIAKFIQPLLSDRDTVVVLASDHLMMKSVVDPILNKKERTNTLFIWDHDLHADEVHQMADQGSTLDIAATVLPLLGFEKDQQFGLGRNLLSSEKNLVQLTGNVTEANAVISSWYPIFRQDWLQGVQNTRVVHISRSGEYIKLGNQELSPPFFINTNKNNTVKELHLSDALKHLTSPATKDSSGIFFGACDSRIFKLFNTKTSDEKLCSLAKDSVGGIYIRHLKNGKTVSLENLFFDSEYASKIPKDDLEAIGKYGTLARYNHNLSMHSSFRGEINVTSSGYMAGTSRVDTTHGRHLLVSHRGFNVYSVSDDGSVDFLGSIDSCEPPPGEHRTIAGLLGQKPAESVAQVVVVNDSAYCGSDIGWATQSTALPTAKKIPFRAPYVAVIQNGSATEFVGDSSWPLRVQLQGADPEAQ